MKSELNQKGNNLFFGVLILLYFFADLFLQFFFREKLFGVENTGVAAGLFGGLEVSAIVFVWLSLFIFAVAIFLKKREMRMSFVFILIGGAVNISQRVMFGSVWDYIFLPFLAMWVNMSDLAISMGVVLYIWGK